MVAGSVIAFSFAFLSLSVLSVTGAETVEEAAVHVRKLIQQQSIGTLASVYPTVASSGTKDWEGSSYGPSRDQAVESHPTHNLQGAAFALPEYYAPCFPNNGSLLLILFKLSQNAHNILIEPEVDALPSRDERDGRALGDPANGKERWRITGPATFVVQDLPLKASPVTRPRVSLMGNLTLITGSWSSSLEKKSGTPAEDKLAACYLERHPDTKWWIPGKGSFHDVAWARFDPHSIYYVGGFGGLHYIGYIPLSLYQSVGLNLGYGRVPSPLVVQVEKRGAQ